jgi:hypothetical protein
VVGRALNERLLEARKWGFWAGTKTAPRRAVRWDPVQHPDGRQSFRGRNWVEVLPHGEDREPERFFGADIEAVGPHEWLTYYPAAGEPICGWGRPRLPDGGMQYCPRTRVGDAAFCPQHMIEVQGEDTHAEHGEGQDAQRPDPE